MQHGIVLHVSLEHAFPIRSTEINLIEHHEIVPLADEQELGQIRLDLVHAFHEVLEENHVGIHVSNDSVGSMLLGHFKQPVDQRRAKLVAVDVRNMQGTDLSGHLARPRFLAEKNDLGGGVEPGPTANGILLNGLQMSVKRFRHREDCQAGFGGLFRGLLSRNFDLARSARSDALHEIIEQSSSARMIEIRCMTAENIPRLGEQADPGQAYGQSMGQPLIVRGLPKETREKDSTTSRSRPCW